MIATGLVVVVGPRGQLLGPQRHHPHAGLRGPLRPADLSGKPPFGGHILSHDFVEAALIRRAGWTVYMLPELDGSYEESPPSLIDLADPRPALVPGQPAAHRA